MDNLPDKPARVARNQVRVLKNILPPGGRSRGVVTMAPLERAAARRKWLMISAAVLGALIAGVLLGRFLLP